MSIISLEVNNYPFSLNINEINKIKFGEVITPFPLIEKIINLLPKDIFSNSKLSWLDPCVGSGNFMIFIYKKLYQSLQTEIKAPKKRHYHIITKMLHMVELNPEYSSSLKQLFGENSNIKICNFLEINNKNLSKKYDIIVGNPPFNSGGIIVKFSLPEV